MTLNEYQRHALRSAPQDYDDPKATLVYALGLTGESGEVADIVKKWHGQGHTLDRDKIVKELGDILWYIACMADTMGWTLSEVAEANVQKLLARYPNGFSTEDSVNRKEAQG